MINDTDKLNAAVDAMAACMGKVLSLKDNEIAKGRMTLGQVLYQEREHFPTRGQLDEIENINKGLQFVGSAHALATKLYTETKNTGNVVLTQYSTEPTFVNSWTFTRSRGDGREESRLRVGGLRRCIFKTAVDLVYKWLLDCDEAMMMAFSDMPKGERVDEAPLHSLAHNLAESIARRISLWEDNRQRDEAEEDLSSRVLQERASEEWARTAVAAEEHQRTDLIALRAFETLSTHGPESEKGRQVLDERLHYIRYVVHTPPVELGLTGNNAARMNLSLLARACDMDMDIDVRLSIVSKWHMMHGACAATAAAQAVRRIQILKNKQPTPFIRVLQAPSEDGHAQRGVELPRMPFVHEDQKWRFVLHPDQRTSLDWLGRRIVRMTSLMLQLLAHGSLERGVVSSMLTAPIFFQAVLEAEVVHKLLKMKLESYTVGTNLLRFCENVTDVESHLCSDMTEAMLPLAHFSTLELISIFSSQSPALHAILNEFTLRTRNNLTFEMPQHYVCFAYDAMPILLPAIRNQRQRLGMSLLQTSTPICNLLKAVPRVCGWSPLQGSLRLELEDLKGQPKLLVHMLKEFAKRKTLVQFKRPYLGNQRYAAKMAFVFDTSTLGCAQWVCIRRSCK